MVAFHSLYEQPKEISQMKKIVLLILVLLASPSLVSAQTLSNSDVAVWLSDSEFNEPTITDDDGSVTLKMDEGTGFGLSFNHFWVSSFSTELAYHRFGGDVEAAFDDGTSFDAGELRASSLTGVGQWHFRRATRFSPYIGGGVAYMNGEFDPFDVEDATLDFEPELTWVVNFGANVAITERLAIGIDAKYIEWEAQEENDEEEERLELTPLVLSAGLRFRF